MPFHVAIMHTKASIIMKILTIVTPRLANHLNEGSIGDVAPRLELHRIPESQENLLQPAPSTST